MNPPRSLLLIKPGSMGDVIHTLPVAAALHQAWPKTRLCWLIDPRWQPLLENHPAIDAFHPFPRTSFRGLLGKLRAVRWYCDLESLQPDLALDLQGLFRSGLMAKLSRALTIRGLSDCREGSRYFYHKITSIDPQAHAVDRYLGILRGLGIPVPSIPDFTIYSKKTNLSCSMKERYIVFHPFSRGADKALSREAISAFIAEFALHADIPILLVGSGEADRSSAVVDLTNRTSLGDLVELMRGADFVVSVDSGPMHLAAALGTPLLGIHTWSDPRRVGPYRTDAWIWQGGRIRLQDLHRPPDPEVPFTSDQAREVARFVAGRLR